MNKTTAQQETKGQIPSIKELEEELGKNTNIMKLLRERSRIDRNAPDAILISYDLQSGSYTELMKDPEYRAVKQRINQGISAVLNPLLRGGTLLEAGVGEASTLAGILHDLRPSNAAAFDIAWSRVAYARRLLESEGHSDVQLFTGDIGVIPVVDSAFDVVYTAHALEPNGGRERECLQELYRITRNWLVLFEPAYELANEAARKRVEQHGYCRGLPKIAEELGYEVTEHRLFNENTFDYNQSQLIVIRKPASNSTQAPEDTPLACPVCKKRLIHHLNNWFCEECYSVYAVIGEIPCLLPGNGILATKFMSFP